MATRKALVLVSGLFQELNSSSDKLDFAGNSTSDLSEGTNQYFTTTRARSSVSVTDTGGFGSLAYNNSTGVLTFTGTSDANVRGSLSVASGSGLVFNTGTGEFTTNAIPNAQLANSSVTIGSTSVALGATASTIAGLNSVSTSELFVPSQDAANSVRITSADIVFEGATANNFETFLRVTDPTADRIITFPDAGGTVALTSDIVYPVTLDNSVTLTNKTLALGSNTISGTLAQFNTAVTNATLVSTTGTETLTNKSLTAPVLTGSSSSAGSIIFKEDTDNGTNSATLKGPASTADVTITLPAETGTVLTTASSIANSNLANSTVTIGSSAVALGSSLTTLTGITSLTSDAVVAKANGFRVIDNTDTTKQVAFDASGIATSTTRTLTVPNASDTLALLAATQTFTNKTLTSAVLNGAISGTSIKDEDNMSSNSASHLATQQSIKSYVDTEIAGITGDITAVTAGTGLSGGGTSGDVTLNIDSTVATLTGSQTLTNKTVALGSNTVSGTLAQFNTAVTDATLVASGAIVNADINASAAISGSKIDPDFGSQTVTTTGTVNTGLINASSASDQILNLNSSDNGAVYLAFKRSGGRKAYFGYGGTGSTLGLVNEISDGDIVISGNDGGSTINMLSFNTSENGRATFIGDIVVGGTVDGVDIATRDTLFGGLTASSGVLSNGVTATTQSASDNSTKVATTAYVDNQVSSGAVSEFADNVFRVKDNSDASKKLAFECSGISGSTTRTMTVPNTDGTISTESFATAIAVALG